MDMDLELLASSQRTASALTLSAVVSLRQLFVMTDLDSDEFSQEAPTRWAVWKARRTVGVGLTWGPSSDERRQSDSRALD